MYVFTQSFLLCSVFRCSFLTTPWWGVGFVGGIIYEVAEIRRSFEIAGAWLDCTDLVCVDPLNVFTFSILQMCLPSITMWWIWLYTIGGRGRMEAELTDIGAKGTFPHDLCIKFSGNNLCVKGIFDCVAVFFSWGVSTNTADVKKFCSVTYYDYSFVHRNESRDNITKSLQPQILTNCVYHYVLTSLPYP